MLDAPHRRLLMPFVGGAAQRTLQHSGHGGGSRGGSSGGGNKSGGNKSPSSRGSRALCEPRC